MTAAYVTLGLPRILHALRDVPGVTRLWKTPDGERYWIAVENLRHEGTIADRLTAAEDQAAEQAGGAEVVFLFQLVLPNAWNTVPADARVCWSTEAR